MKPPQGIAGGLWPRTGTPALWWTRYLEPAVVRPVGRWQAPFLA
ncbi:uncharacterized protein METZ01_LOCUS489002 [marine metagenome]|uniref:Uncharacterized protein n=1 Tax=marine metagenome TaxID=408172 RepID=A0A383CWX1_9ZZZZ